MIVNDGALLILEAYRQALQDPTLIGGAVAKFGLLKADFTPAVTTHWADVSALEATFIGYARIVAATVAVNPPTLVGGEPEMVCDLLSFGKTVGAPDQTIFGWFLILLDGAGVVMKLLELRKFLGPQPLTDADPLCEFFPYLFGVGV